MDPYVTFSYQDQQYKTLAAEDRGKFPIWNQIYELNIISLEDEIIFKVMDKDLFYDDAIGFCSVKLSALCINGGGESNFDIYWNEGIVGTLKLMSKYTPKQEMSYKFESEYIQSQINDKKITVNFKRAEKKQLTVQKDKLET